MVAVVANPVYRSVAYTRAFDAQEGLSRLPNWLFLTGSLAQLQQAWRNYGIAAQVLPGGGMIAHNDVAYVIDKAWRTRAELNFDPGSRHSEHQVVVRGRARWHASAAGHEASVRSGASAPCQRRPAGACGQHCCWRHAEPRPRGRALPTAHAGHHRADASHVGVECERHRLGRCPDGRRPASASTTSGSCSSARPVPRHGSWRRRRRRQQRRAGHGRDRPDVAGHRFPAKPGADVLAAGHYRQTRAASGRRTRR